MDVSNRLSLSYPAVQSIPAVPVTANKQAGAPQAVSAPAPTGKSDTSSSKDSDAEKNSQKLKAAVQDMEKFFQSTRRNLSFSVDEGSGKVVVKVIATETGEVVRQLPSAEALKIADNLQNAHSLLFDAKA
jgi:flagellar protein FlaG